MQYVENDDDRDSTFIAIQGRYCPSGRSQMGEDRMISHGKCPKIYKSCKHSIHPSIQEIFVCFFSMYVVKFSFKG